MKGGWKAAFFLQDFLGCKGISRGGAEERGGAEGFVRGRRVVNV
jgi:hypothetical protein